MRAYAQENPSAEPEQAVASEPVDVSLAGLADKVEAWVEGAIRLLPNFAVAIVVLLLFWGLGIAAKNGVRRWAYAHDRSNLGDVLGGFVKAVVIACGALVAVTVILPSLRPGDLVAGLGIGSVAIGFAFKDILQNWLAGLLILFNRPFRPGDQIIVKDYEGTVDHIETRVTALRTYDGRLVLVPNSDVYTNAVTVNTAFEKRRSEYDVGIGYGDDIAKARRVIMKAVQSAEGVELDPAPEVLVVDLAASWVTLRPRWWTDSRRASVIHVQSRVIEAVKRSLDEAGIDIPFETQVQLFHDQTDEFDGIRGKQREGWPANKNGNPRPLRDVIAAGKQSDEGERRRDRRLADQ